MFLLSLINKEVTALGAFYLVALQQNIYKTLEDIKQVNLVDKIYSCNMKSEDRIKLLNGWSKAIKKSQL